MTALESKLSALMNAVEEELAATPHFHELFHHSLSEDERAASAARLVGWLKTAAVNNLTLAASLEEFAMLP